MRHKGLVNGVPPVVRTNGYETYATGCPRGGVLNPRSSLCPIYQSVTTTHLPPTPTRIPVVVTSPVGLTLLNVATLR